MKILFLTNNKNTQEAYEYLKSVEKQAMCIGEPLALEMLKEISPDYVVSYNYSYILKEDVINYMNGNIINLHASYLPWNRGSHPNFWSFIDDTPKGITIHYLNKSLDKGAIILQKQFEFKEEEESFVSTYNYLQKEMIQLFCNNWMLLRENGLQAYVPKDKGTYHSIKDFQIISKNTSFSWKDSISEVKSKIHKSKEGRKNICCT